MPPAEIRIRYAAEPPKGTEAALPLPPARFEARIPAEAAGLPYFLPASSLNVEQKIDHSLKGLKAGDSIRRTITVTVARTQPMLIPPVEWDAPDGVRVYPQEPSLSTIGADREGFVAGQRMDSASYLVLQEGDYELPAVMVVWWDTSAGKVRQAVAPALRFHAGANPGYVPDLAPEPEPEAPAPQPAASWRTLLQRWAGWLLGGIAFVTVCWLLGRRYASRFIRRRREAALRREQSEEARFERLVKALRSGDAISAYAELLTWRRAGLELTDDPAVAREVDALSASLYSASRTEEWSADGLVTLLRQYRKSRSSSAAVKSALAILNPGPH